MLNPNEGGTFVLTVDNLTDPLSDDGEFTDYATREAPFKVVKADGSVDTLTAIRFGFLDCWSMIETTANDTIAKYVAKGRNYLALNYGITVRMDRTVNVGYQPRSNENNGLRAAREDFGETGKWLLPTNTNWLIGPGAAGDPDPLQNPTDALLPYDFSSVFGGRDALLDGAWSVYAVTNPYLTFLSNGPAYDYLSGVRPPYSPTTPSTPAARQRLFNKGVSIQQSPNVDIVITEDKDQWTRVVVLQADSSAITFQGSRNLTRSTLPSVNKNFERTGELSAYSDTVPSRGMSWFPGYAIDIDRGVRLNIMFAEAQNADEFDTTATGEKTNSGHDLIWNPSTRPDGGKHYLYIMNTIYDEARRAERQWDSASSVGATRLEVLELFKPATWVANLRLNPNFAGQTDFRAGILPGEVRYQFRVNKKFDVFGRDSELSPPVYNFNTNGLAPSTQQVDVAKGVLDQVRIVPNPYYAYSPYETSQIDNRVKITNLPQKCVVSIYNIGGSLVRRFNIGRTGAGINNVTFIDWDLKNQDNIPISSGTYIIHVDAGELGETTLKFFGVMRPADFDSVRN